MTESGYQSWRTDLLRTNIRNKIEEAIRMSGNPTFKTVSEMESHISDKARTKEEYLSFVARLILHFREMSAKMSGVQNESLKRSKVPKESIDKKFKSDFSVLYETKRNSDVILVAGSQQFSAHKAILTARSDVFAAMFDNQMRESIENKVEIKDINPEVLEVMLLYIYTGKVKDMDKIGAPLMTAADKYGLDQLKTICSEELTRIISTNTAIETLIFSKLMNDSNLERSALEFIRDNIRDVIKTKDWSDLKKSDSELLDEIVMFLDKHPIVNRNK